MFSKLYFIAGSVQSLKILISINNINDISKNHEKWSFCDLTNICTNRQSDSISWNIPSCVHLKCRPMSKHTQNLQIWAKVKVNIKSFQLQFKVKTDTKSFEISFSVRMCSGLKLTNLNIIVWIVNQNALIYVHKQMNSCPFLEALRKCMFAG